MEVQQIVPGVPVAEQRQNAPQPSPLTPDDLQMSIINKTFNRSDYQNQMMLKQLADNARREQTAVNNSVNVQYRQPAQQNDTRMNDFNTPEFQRSIAEDIARARTATASTQNQMTPPQQTAAPQQNIQPSQQTEQSQKDMFSDDYFKKLFGDQTETKQPEQTAQQTPPSTPGMQPDEMQRINDYIQKNADYIDQVQLESARRGINPNLVFQQLSKKSIAEMVDFALGINNTNRMDQQMAQPNAQQNFDQQQPQQNYRPGPSVTDMYGPKQVVVDANRPGSLGGSFDLNL